MQLLDGSIVFSDTYSRYQGAVMALQILFV